MFLEAISAGFHLIMFASRICCVWSTAPSRLPVSQVLRVSSTGKLVASLLSLLPNTCDVFAAGGFNVSMYAFRVSPGRENRSTVVRVVKSVRKVSEVRRIQAG